VSTLLLQFIFLGYFVAAGHRPRANRNAHAATLDLGDYRRIISRRTIGHGLNYFSKNVIQIAFVEKCVGRKLNRKESVPTAPATEKTQPEEGPY
jgi:hypothetical protein